MKLDRPKKAFIAGTAILAAISAAGLLIGRRPTIAKEGLPPRLTVSVMVMSDEEPKPDVLKALDLARKAPKALKWKLLDIDPARPEVHSARDAIPGFWGKAWLAPVGDAAAWIRKGDDGLLLWSRGPRGGDEHRLMELGKSGEHEIDVAFSPDAERFVASVGAMHQGVNQRKYASWLMRADGSDRTALPLPESDCIQDWSPDGHTLLVDSSPSSTFFHPGQGDPRWELRLANIDGTGLRTLATCRYIQEARFSPDGRTIAFIGIPESAEVIGLWSIGTDGQGPRRIIDFAEQGGSDARWSPDGKRLALCVHDLVKVKTASGSEGITIGDMRIEIVDLDGGNRRAIPTPAPYRLGSPLRWR